MGSGRYHEDVHTARQSVGTIRLSQDAFRYSEDASNGRAKGVHPDLNIRGRIRESCDCAEHPQSTPIVVAMDVTSSRGNDAHAVYAQVPSFLGSIQTTEVVPDPQIMWAAIGDANSDVAPIQVGQFESDRRIDAELAKIWMEKGGGGTGEESYELLAWYLANRTRVDAIKRGRKGFVFFTGDEAPYETLSKSQVKTHIGVDLDADISSTEVFRGLQEGYHTFLIFPRTTVQQRMAAIDSEIRQRLERLGGRFKEVNIRASLIWNNRNDLDLHCLTPAGYHIYYGSKRAHCRGELDVDRNVHGEDPKPVENIRWAKGDALNGHYKFWVEHYAYHEHSQAATPFKVELDIDGEIQSFEGVIPANAPNGRKVDAFEFDYVTPETVSGSVDERSAYQDEVVLAKWGKYIPATHILRVQDPASAVEVMLGVLALQGGKMTLDGFVESMQSRSVPAERQVDVREALAVYAAQGVFSEVDSAVFA